MERSTGNQADFDTVGPNDQLGSVDVKIPFHALYNETDAPANSLYLTAMISHSNLAMHF
jgi:hypothetical protein